MGFHAGARKGKREGIVALVVGLGMVVPSVARAEKPRSRTSSLTWNRLSGAEECVSLHELARDVESRLGRRVFVSVADADVGIEGHIESRGKRGWRATIILADSRGVTLSKKEITRDDRSCAAMRDPISLVVALMIDPTAKPGDPKRGGPPETAPTESYIERKPGSKPREPQQEAKPEAKPEAAPDARPDADTAPEKKPDAPPPDTVEPPPDDTPSDRDQWRIEGSGGIAGGIGILPKVASAFDIDAIVAPPRFLTLHGFLSVWGEQTTVVNLVPNTQLSAVLLGAGVCPFWPRGDRWRFALCGDLLLGLAKGSGDGRNEQKPLIGLAVDPRITLRIVGPISLRAGLMVGVPIIRPGFTAKRVDFEQVDVFKMSPVIGALDFGVGVAFP